jgi:hypothetical protein
MTTTTGMIDWTGYIYSGPRSGTANREDGTDEDGVVWTREVSGRERVWVKELGPESADDKY